MIEDFGFYESGESRELGPEQVAEEFMRGLEQADADVAAYERGEGTVRRNPELDIDVYIPPAPSPENP